MKELSARTGISDRTIRYYIDDGLFVPEKYTENFEGRRSYDFTENDVESIKIIATLRKYDFSIIEIKYILSPEGDVQKTLEEHINKVKEKSDLYINLINNMTSSLNQSPWTPQELCKYLVESEIEPKKVDEDTKDEEEKLAQNKRDIKAAIISGIIMAISLLAILILYRLKTGNRYILNWILGIEIICGYQLLKNAYKHIKNTIYVYLYIVFMISLTVYSLAEYY